MAIARVFPRQTRMSPTDPDAYFGPPELFMSEYNEIQISVSFTWDIDYAKILARQWEHIAPVKIGGPAIDGEGNGFIPGRYLKKGITITSRGCPNKCPWCMVKAPLKELEIHPGNNIVDNNILACSRGHLDKVFSMLKTQRIIKLSGGLEARRITEKIVEQIRGLKLRQLWIAYDHPANLKAVKRAMEILTKYFSRDHIGCYCLIGQPGDTMSAALGRLQQIVDLGAFPYAMLYKGPNGKCPEPGMAWRKLQKMWLRPAYIRARIKGRIA
jgi:hypothetical protein